MAPYLFLLLIFLGLAVLLLIVAYTLKTGISPMPSTRRIRSAMADFIPPNIQMIYDLGSGWGGLVFHLAQRFPNAVVTGYELSPVPCLWSKLWARLCCLRNARFIRRNFLKVKLDSPAAVVCYLYPGAMPRVRDLLINTLPPGTLVISYAFAVPGWKPWATRAFRGILHSRLYVYYLPMPTSRATD